MHRRMVPTFQSHNLVREKHINKFVANSVRNIYSTLGKQVLSSKKVTESVKEVSLIFEG